MVVGSIVVVGIGVGVGMGVETFVDVDETSPVCVFVVGSTSSVSIVSILIVQAWSRRSRSTLPNQSTIPTADKYHPQKLPTTS